MQIRTADPTDSDELLAWRNDPVARSMFINPSQVNPREHQDWFSKSLVDPSRTLYIGLLDGRKVGVCRFDYHHTRESAEISINLNPNERGKGLSYPFLKSAIEVYFKKERACLLEATIKKNNYASKRLFEKCGFVSIGVDGDFMLYHLVCQHAEIRRHNSAPER